MTKEKINFLLLYKNQYPNLSWNMQQIISQKTMQ